MPITVENHHDDDGTEPMLMVHVTICDNHGTHLTASGNLVGDLSDERLAATMIRAALGVAAARDTGHWLTLQHALSGYGADLAGDGR